MRLAPDFFFSRYQQQPNAGNNHRHRNTYRQKFVEVEVKELTVSDMIHNKNK